MLARTVERRGGIETYLEMALAGMSRLGHSLLLACEEALAPGAAAITVPSNVTVIEPGPGPKGELGLQVAGWHPDVVLSHGLFDPRLDRACLAAAPSVFMAHAYHGTCISGHKMFRVPVETPCHRRFGAACLALYLPRRCGGRSPITMVAEYRRQQECLAVVRSCAAVVTLSNYMRDEFVGHGVDQARVTTLPEWRPAVSPSGLEGPPSSAEALRVTFVGRLEREKGVHLALRALPELHRRLARPVHLSIAGSGPFAPALRAIAADVESPGLEVSFLGQIDAVARGHLLAATDVVVFSSIWPEPYGLVGQEAAAAGVPVAAFRVGGVPEWLRDGVSGALADAEPPTAAKLAAAMIRCAVDPQIRHGASATRGRQVAGGDAHLRALERVLAGAVQAPGLQLPAVGP